MRRRQKHTLMKRILFVFIIFLASCRSVSSIESLKSNVESQDIQTFRSVDTIVMHDSVFIHERTKGDTVYLTRTEWRERWRTQIVHDTIRDTQYVTQVIEKPPVRYVPKFYRWCTIAWWAIGLSAIGYWRLKWWLKPKSVIRP